MILNTEQIKSVTSGVVNVEYSDGLYRFYRMTDGEYDITEKTIAEATAGVYLEFCTDAQLLKLKVKTELSMGIRSFFAFDIFSNGELIGCIKNFEDEKCTGNYSSGKYEVGNFSGEFSLEGGEKQVKIVMPHTLIGCIKELELVGASYITPCRKNKTLIAYGDSITQGYDALHPSKIYATCLAEHLGAEPINKAIGGAVFESYRVDASLHTNVDYVTVAFGTNDWTVHTPKQIKLDAAEYIKSVVKKYPHAHIFVITPIWRASADTEKVGGAFYDLEGLIREAASEYPFVNVISGIDLVEHLPECFGDLVLHPSDKGFEFYSKNLCAKVDEVLEL